MDFHVTGALEFFENDFVHAGACINEGSRDDAEGAAFFDITSSAEEPLWLMKGIGIDTTGKNLAGVRLDRVVSASETSDRVEQDDDIPLVLDHAPGLFNHHFCNLNVPL